MKAKNQKQTFTNVLQYYDYYDLIWRLRNALLLVNRKFNLPDGNVRSDIEQYIKNCFSLAKKMELPNDKAPELAVFYLQLLRIDER